MSVERAQRIGRSCWRCREPVAGPRCASCEAIQPPPAEADHFALLGLERAWFLDLRAMEGAYRALSRQVHPDRYAGKSAVERRMSLQWTAALNEARRVLRDDLSRAWYLSTGSAQPPEEDAPTPGPAFLEQVFDLQMEARADPEGVRRQASALRAAEWAGLEADLRAWEAGQAGLDAVPERLARLKYLDNILHSTAPALDAGG